MIIRPMRALNFVESDDRRIWRSVLTAPYALGIWFEIKDGKKKKKKKKKNSSAMCTMR
jgi:hypothetical protein